MSPVSTDVPSTQDDNNPATLPLPVYEVDVAQDDTSDVEASIAVEDLDPEDATS